MFDLFGMGKVDAKDAIEAMTRGMTLGLLDAYEIRLDEKEREIKRLRERIIELDQKIEANEQTKPATMNVSLKPKPQATQPVV